MDILVVLGIGFVVYLAVIVVVALFEVGCHVDSYPEEDDSDV